MTRQRNYAAEYAARSKERITETRQATAERYGFKSYGTYRRASETILKDLDRLDQRKLWDYRKDDFLKARAILLGYNPKTIKRAADRKESLLGRTKEGRAVRARLRQALGFGEGAGWQAVYFPAMRSLY